MMVTSSSSAALHRAGPTAWVGWIAFAALLMVLSGAFSIIWGLAALFRNQVFLVGGKGNVISLDYTAWGWIHLLIGAAVIGAGLALLTGAVWAAVVAVALAMLSAIGQLLSISSYPVWAVIVITFDVLVIYAISVHGGEIRDVEV